MSEPTKSDTPSWQTLNWNRQRDELQAQAEKRFWKLVPAANGGQFEIHDQLGRVICGADFFPGLRGFFAGLPPQA